MVFHATSKQLGTFDQRAVKNAVAAAAAVSLEANG